MASAGELILTIKNGRAVEYLVVLTALGEAVVDHLKHADPFDPVAEIFGDIVKENQAILNDPPDAEELFMFKP